MTEDNKTVLYQCGQDSKTETNTGDPVTTEVIRSALQSAANQMCNTLTRTTFSPICLLYTSPSPRDS